MAPAQTTLKILKQLGLEEEPFAHSPGQNTPFESYKRVQQLKYLQHLCTYTQRIFLVEGPHGIGKTTFFHQLAQDILSDTQFNCIAIPSGTCSDYNIFIRLLAKKLGIDTNNIGNDESKLGQALMNLPKSRKKTIILIDDADELDKSILQTLFFMLEPIHNSEQVHLILFCQEGFLRKINSLNDFTYNPDKLKMLSISALTPQETKAYIIHHLTLAGMTHIPFSDKDFGDIFQRSKGIPALINQVTLQRLITLPRRIVFKKALQPSLTQSAVLMSLAAGIILSYALYKNETDQYPVEANRISNELLPTDVSQTDDSTQIRIPLKITQLKHPEKELFIETPAIVSDTKAFEGELTEFKLEYQETEAPTANQEDMSQPSLQLSHPFFERQPTHYATQLFGSWQKEDAQKFIDAYTFEHDTTILKTQRQGKPWYIVVTGNYESSQAAKQAIKTMPPSIQALNPWVRSNQSIQDVLAKSSS